MMDMVLPAALPAFAAILPIAIIVCAVYYLPCALLNLYKLSLPEEARWRAQVPWHGRC